MKRPIQIILIDDDIEYSERLKKEAQKHRLLVTHYQNLEDGIEGIEASIRYKFVILDDRCALDKSQKPGTAKSNFVFHAIQELKEMQLKKERFIPFCVTAVEAKEFAEDLDGIAEVFQKDRDHSDMFTYIKQHINQLPEVYIRNKHREVFEFVEDYFSENDEDLLLDLIEKRKNSDASNVIANLSMARRILEKLFDVVAKQVLKRSPDSYKSFRQGRTKSIIAELDKQQIIPTYMNYAAKNLYTIASKYGNHTPTSKALHFPTNYTVESQVNSLLEMFLWASKLINNK